MGRGKEGQDPAERVLSLLDGHDDDIPQRLLQRAEPLLAQRLHEVQQKNVATHDADDFVQDVDGHVGRLDRPFHPVDDVARQLLLHLPRFHEGLHGPHDAQEHDGMQRLARLDRLAHSLLGHGRKVERDAHHGRLVRVQARQERHELRERKGLCARRVLDDRPQHGLEGINLVCLGDHLDQVRLLLRSEPRRGLGEGRH